MSEDQLTKHTPIGEIGEINGKTFLVAEGFSGCEACDMIGEMQCPIDNPEMECVAERRPDGMDVIYKLVEERVSQPPRPAVMAIAERIEAICREIENELEISEKDMIYAALQKLMSEAR